MKKIPPVGRPGVVVVAALAAALLLKRLLLPVVRRSLRQREIGEAGRRLTLGLPAFKLARSRDLVDRLMVDPTVLEAVQEHSREQRVPEMEATRLAERYAREIAPSFSPYLYFRIGVPLAGLVSRAFYRLGRAGYEPEVEGDATVVFVMNHRSNLDYVILTHLLRDRAALSFAAGEWARAWPLGAFIRAMGSFFVRRGSGELIHRRVLERFVQMAVEGGLTQAVFLEGGLSRDGRPREPKAGLLDYMLRRFDPSGGRDLLFVPVAINYDRVLEDYALTAALETGATGPDDIRILPQVVDFLARNFRLTPGRRPYAAASFGAPISARRYAASQDLDFRALNDEARAGQVKLLAGEIIRAVRSIVPVLPVPAIAHVLVEAPDEPLTIAEIQARVRALTAGLEDRGVRIYLPGGDRDVETGLNLLAARRLITEKDGAYGISPGEIGLLSYYAASISHLTEEDRDGSAEPG